MKNISIMIIDDHTMIRETWRSFLATVDNFRVVAECGEGEIAVEMAKNKRPDIVLLDINMLPMDGMTVLKMIRKMSPASKIIGVSMHSEPAYAKKMLRLGAKGYVTKNSPSDEMITAINEVNKGNVYVCKEVNKIIAAKLTKDDRKLPDINSLTERELQVLGLIRVGTSNKDMAAVLGITLKTIEVHRHHILKKMNSKNTISLINYLNLYAVDL